MGILNVTPDSFSDGGRFASRQAALARARAMKAEGADWIDVGGESTRPGADPVPEAEELGRVIPVIGDLIAEGLGPVSIDTRKAAVMAAAVAAGAGLVNDVSALTHDRESLRVVAGLKCPVVLMHAKGDPRTMQDAPSYDDVVAEVAAFLEARRAAAIEAGVPAEAIWLDPGIGFGKTLAHNLALLRALPRLARLGSPLLLGASRKRMIAALDREGPA
ncbi:MAG: dihydropteroate synthase, partial [Alphaproteobacteria bacterium]|nr:dihydropteroate synthase [Alphaproteobacteria bacterium]